MSPEDVKKYNAVQKLVGGVPLDPYGSWEVCEAVKSIIEAVKKGHADAGQEWIRGAAEHAVRDGGPCPGLTKAERQRVVELVVEYFGPAG